ncbi:aldo/keto reductase [Parablautia intestinalis]|nr:aldo/keto reductase [Parablautia intestinalis]
MRKIFSLILVFLLAFPITACGQNRAGETGTAGGIETIPATDTIEAVQETGTAPDDTGSEPVAEEETIAKAEFDFERRTVMLNSGYEMPVNGLGTYSLHGDECINAVKSALLNGVRLIDTASAYGNEEEIGQAVRKAINEGIIQREDIFVATKIYPGSEMENPVQSIQACLDRLDIGYVDLMLLHHPDPNDVEAYKAMEQFVEEGKIRSIGLPDWYVEELTEFLPQVDTVPAVVQNEIHPYYQESDVIPFIQDLGIVVQGWYPLGGRGHTGDLLGDSVITEIAVAHGVSSAQVILRWNLQKGVVVIPGSSNPDHIRKNTEVYHFSLTEDEMARIGALDRGEKHDWY